MEVFKLFGSIFVDTDEADKSISKTSDKASNLGEKFKSGIKTAAKWGTAIVGAATAIGGAMIKAAKDTADSLGEIDDAAQRIGVDAETMQELQYVAKMSGMELSDLEKAAKKLEGTDLNLDQAIDQIMSLGTAEEQTQKAIELFGESVAYNLQPLLNHGAEGIEEFKQQARDLGIIMSNETVEAGANMGDMFDAVSSSLETLKSGLMAELMPYVMEILQWLVDNLPKIKETVSKVFSALMPIIKPILEGVMALLDGVMSLISGDFEGFVEGIKGLIVGLGKALYTLGKGIITALGKGLKEAWTIVQNWFQAKIDWIKSKFQAVGDWFSNLFGGNKNKTDGSHAAGLNIVPYDNYKATLHRGETVLNSQNTTALIENLTSALSGITGSQSINLVVDGETLARVTYNPLQKIATQKGIIYG